MSFSLSEVLDWTRGTWVNESSLKKKAADFRVQSQHALAQSRAEHVAYFFSKDYQEQLLSAEPGILITGEAFVEPLKAASLPLWSKSAVVACKDPYRMMALLSEKFANDEVNGEWPALARGQASQISHLASVSPKAKVGKSVVIREFCVIEDGASIGDGTVIYPHCTVGKNSSIGEGSKIFSGVQIYHGVQIGKNVRIHANTVIGADGLGYAPIFQEGQKVPQGHAKIYHLGGVRIGDDVELGASVTIDRGTIEDTLIGDKVKLDDQVHIGHNARVDEGAIICGCTALAGRAHVGRYCYVGGLTGIANNVFVQDGAKVGALTLVTRDVPSGETHAGVPQRELSLYFRANAALNKLGRKSATREQDK